MNSGDVKKELSGRANKKKAKILQGFFKTDKGEYGEGDVFLGITVPEQRKVALKFKELPLREIKKLLLSGVHEHRFTALEILVMQYERLVNDVGRQNVVDFYLKNLKNVNNWDLVDTSAPYILGDFLKDKSEKDRKILYKLIKSKNMWERRVAIVSTFAFIKNKDFKDILKINEILIKDKNDLMPKALGWMLREVGKKDEKVLRNFLNTNALKMKRTALRYAIERFDKKEREKYLNLS